MLTWRRVLHELGGLLTTRKVSFDANLVQSATLASLLIQLEAHKITTKSAKTILATIFTGDQRSVEDIIEQDDLAVREIDAAVLTEAAQHLVERHSDMAQKVRSGQKGKFQWFVGQLIREYDGKVDAQKAAAALKPFLDS